jgi:hypothetical protein
VSRSRIVAVGRQRSLPLFVPIVEALRGAGNDVAFYEDAAAFDAATPGLPGLG